MKDMTDYKKAPDDEEDEWLPIWSVPRRWHVVYFLLFILFMSLGSAIAIYHNWSIGISFWSTKPIVDMASVTITSAGLSLFSIQLGSLLRKRRWKMVIGYSIEWLREKRKRERHERLLELMEAEFWPGAYEAFNELFAGLTGTIFREIATKMRDAERAGESTIEAPLDKVGHIVDAGFVRWREGVPPTPRPQHGGPRTDFYSLLDRKGMWVHTLEFTEEGERLARLWQI